MKITVLLDKGVGLVVFVLPLCVYGVCATSISSAQDASAGDAAVVSEAVSEDAVEEDLQDLQEAAAAQETASQSGTGPEVSGDESPLQSDHLAVAMEEVENGIVEQDELIQNHRDQVQAYVEEAQQKAAEQDKLIERARAHLNVVETGGRRDRTADIDALVEKASVVYREEREYLDAYKLAHEALEIDPAHEKAKELKRSIKHDLENVVTIGIPYDKPYQPPEGVLAYKVAVSDGLVTLEEAQEIAVKNSVLLASMQKRVKGAERKLTEARRALFPTISAEAVANGGIVAGDAYQGESWKLNLSHTVFDGGELIFTLKQAEANVGSDKAKYAKERLELVHRVGEAYRGVVTADYNLAYQDSLLAEVDEIKARTDEEHNEKLIPEIDYLEVGSLHNQVIFQKVSAESAYLQAKLILAQELGIDPSLPTPLDTVLGVKEIPLDLEVVRRTAQKHNWDIRLKELAAEGAFYNVKVFDAKKMPKIELRGSMGLQGESSVGAGYHNDLENEHFIGIEGSLPLGGNTIEYGYTRRFFGPTVLSLTGSEDYRHRVAFFLLDKLADLTDADIAKADYLVAKDEVQKERVNTDVRVHEAFYDYKGALLQIDTSLSKIKFREKQVSILKVLASLEESKVSSLVNEMMALSEDRFAYVKAVAETHDTLSNINRLIGIEGYYGNESRS